MSTFDSIKMRGERLKKMMDDTLQPDKAWESIHPHHSPPKKYPNPNFLTNPDVNDPRNFTENGGNHIEGDSDDFYEYLTDEDEEGKEERKDGKQHAIDEAYLARLRELEKKKKLDEIRDKINNDADHNFTKYQINKTRTIDPFEKSEEPLVLQLYLRIYGGYFMNPRDITLLQDTEQRLSQMNVFRNSFVQYKDFPKGRLQRTTTELQSNNPIYNHKAYFPVLVRPDIIEKLAKFNFLFEVRDQVTTDDTPIIGFTKLSLSSFFKSLVSEDNGYLNTSHFDEAANQYPMVGFDDRADIMDFNGKCVGWLQITMALGSPEQINFFDRIQQERDKAREEEEEERRRMDRRKKKKDLDEDSDSVRDKQMEDLLRELIDTIKDKSTSSSSKRERGKWEDNHLDSLHKLFEECRLEGTKDIKMKVFADSKDKNSFENDLLDNTTLNRKSVNNILQIWNYGNGYDIKQLQESYNAYCRYCTHAEGKVKSIFEKLQVFFDIHDDQNKRKPRRQEDEEMEKKNLAAKWCKDKEMREGFNLIIDLFQGHGDPDQSINMEEFLKFLKTPPFVGKEHICLSAMKQEILTEKVVLDHKKDFNHGIADSILEAGQRDDYLYDPIRALDYQNSCAENDIPITIWEIFWFFHYINKEPSKEPQRYHFWDVPKILHEVGYPEIWEKYESATLEKRKIIEARRKKAEDANPRKSLENFDDTINPKEESKIDPIKPHYDESGIFDRKEDTYDYEDPDEDDDDQDVFDILNESPAKKKHTKPDGSKPPKTKDDKRDKTKKNKDIDPRRSLENPKEEHKDTADFMVGRKDYTEESDDRLPDSGEETIKVKHIFEIKIKEISNIPILKKIIKDLSRGSKESEEPEESKYIQDVFIKYIFPLDDEQIVSDYIEFSPRKEDSYDYAVSMHSYHTYLLETTKPVNDSLKKWGESFTINLSCLKDNQDVNIGTLQLPIEDLMDLVEDYEKQPDTENKSVKVPRILFLRGTRFSQRDEGIIGKLYIDFIYKREIVKVSSNRGPGVSISNDLYLQKEVYINRKIPLKGYLSVNIGSLSDLKDSLENIEYLISLYNHPDSRESMWDRTLLSAQHVDTNKRVENIDRKRALLRMYKEGLNIGIVESIFEETPELRDRFGTKESRVIFQTLHPNFEYQNEHRIWMNTTIFEHLKYRFAVFEVRHYFVNEDSDLLDLGRRKNQSNDPNSEFRTDERDYITLGWAKVPLANLITKSNGIDQDVAVLDQFNQKLGYLKIKMSLNYQSRKHMQLMKEPSEALYRGKYFLGFSFVELISQHNRYLRPEYMSKDVKNLIFKFKWKGDHHQVRYVPDEKIEELPLDITVYFINKLYLLEIDINEETFEESATPIEIQIWTKVENKTQCYKDKEALVGSIFVDVQTLIKGIHNFRLRNESKQIVNTHDGYYTVLNTQSNTIMMDRVGLSTMLIKKEDEGQKERIEKMFYILHNHARKSILDHYDLNLKGIIEISDMKKIVNTFFEDPKDIDLVYKYLECWELEVNPTTLQSPDWIYYSPYLNVLPPFFKYARRIDKEQIIEFIYKRLSSVDNYENGFVDNNMFKSILECEVNLKEKIVDDFIENLKPSQLDYNLSSHTMKLQTDYLLLVRKLYGYLIHWDLLKLGEEDKKVDQPPAQEELLELPEERKCSLKISISNGNNIKNPSNENSPPNTYVLFKNPFGGNEVELRTPVIYRTTFPQWDYTHEIQGISINEIWDYLLNNWLEFEIYHKKLPNETLSNHQESIQIGKTYVDASHLVKSSEISLTGYYHVFKTEEDKQLDDFEETKRVAQGQLKLNIRVDKPLLCEFDIQDTELKEQQIMAMHRAKESTKGRHTDVSPIEETKVPDDDEEDEAPLQRAIRMARELREKNKNNTRRQTAARLTKVSRPSELMVNDEENEDQNIPFDINELRVKKNQNLIDLQNLTNMLKSRQENYRDDIDEQDDDLERATVQEFAE